MRLSLAGPWRSARSAAGALAHTGVAAWRITLVRHTVYALVAVGLGYLAVKNLSDFRDTQLTQIAYTVCAVAGLTVLTGLSGQISLGNGAFMLVGAYTVGLTLRNWGLHPGTWQLVGTLAEAAIVAALFGAVVGLAAARLRGPYLAGATLALAIGLPSMASYEKLTSHLGGSNGITFPTPNAPKGFDYFEWPAFVSVVAAIVVVWLLANLTGSRVGRSWRAVRDDEIAASLAGLSVSRVQVRAFVVSAAAAGVGGGLEAFYTTTAGPDAFGLALSLSLLAAAVFGGLGSLAGAVYGSVLIILLPKWSEDVVKALSLSGTTALRWKDNLPIAIYGIVLAVAMLGFPSGVQGALVRLSRLVRPHRGR
jgi:branched-chain amino acid transport system permease protein